ncbi:4-hydroxy-tetrahydrodipicolinate synthase [Paraburkholderia eburnea]|uniref:4-hydroxy-tetrahydrodipicolinate synthase n=1 Tax=Paraburkholderia eburnea TaxID=1189126 RepID=A0A2S4M8Q3_9BURK|nr:4-hydroxy-tetrahydrodipicolinate synthase [Paraburkholderia eburnea]POR50979.1 4-hydroxy-tetrahydrodipicolinate synthase [Paraburkholderia eburnea]PRZ21714.1 4-hydroxy-tetrahydrodipicolinate synthase [Paraburkholderia eburnea]
MSSFSGIWIPLVTPFNGGAVDHEALDALVRHYVQAGVAGFVALGTTGEPAALDAREQDAVLVTVLASAGALPVVAGVSGNHTQSVCERIAALNDTPVAGVLAAGPYYIRPSQAGVIGHFAALADASRKPVILYDIPARTGVTLALPTLLELAGHERIVAVKDCGGSLDKTLALILDGRLQVLCGEDLDMFGMMCAGASGAIAASAHVLPQRFVAMARALREGRLEEARAIWHTLVPLVRAAFAEPNPGPVKAALARQGLLHNELRAPMTRVSDELEETLGRLVA